VGTSDLWYRNAIFYAVDVETFLDSNGDGRGDFKGLIARLDSLAELGVTCIWLLPFYPSPFRDNGYDVSDHYGVEPDELHAFFGAGVGDEMNLLFNFLLDNYLFLAFARGEAEPLRWVLQLLPERPETGQWANFLRNLDELDLERLTESEREEVYRAFAPEERMRVYGRGIRRRLAPMLRGDRRRLEMAYSLLLTLPGAPVLFYGDEIGMGDDLSQRERWAVRTPMQWSATPNAGFSTAAAERLVRPVISRGRYSYRKVNVEAQQADPDSLLHWMKRAIRARKTNPVLDWGEYRWVETGHPALAAHRCDWEGDSVVAVHNLSSRRAAGILRLEDGEAAESRDLLSPGTTPGAVARDGSITLDAYGYRWLGIGRPRDYPHHR
jgi:maltose alpha-D-glucosyltransferase/alpha-amylase